MSLKVNLGIPSWAASFEAQGRRHQKSETGVSVATQKGLMSSKKFQLIYARLLLLYRSRQLILINVSVFQVLNPVGEIEPGYTAAVEWKFSPLEAKTYMVSILLPPANEVAGR